MRTFRTSVVAISLALATLNLAHAGSQEGRLAYLNKNYAAALQELLPAAQEGDAGAQGMVGDMYLNGLGVGKNFAESAKWFQLAADNGDINSMNALGRLYVQGQGVAQNHDLARTWFRRSDVSTAIAETTNGTVRGIVEKVTSSATVDAISCRQLPPAMPQIAVQNRMVGIVKAAVFLVDGIVKDVIIFSGPKIFHQPVREAMLKYDCGSSRANTLATQAFDFRMNLGGAFGATSSYEIELIHPKFAPIPPSFNSDWQGLTNENRAAVRRQYTNLQSQDEPPYPTGGMGDLIENIRLLAEHAGSHGKLSLIAKISPKGAMETVTFLESPDPALSKFAAEVLYLASFKPASCAGQPCTMDIPLEVLITRGNKAASGNQSPAPVAQRSLIEDAIKGEAHAQNQLGERYERGRDVLKDDSQAFKWYQLSALQGFAAGQANLGRMYESGRGVERSLIEAAALYRKAAEQNYAPAQSHYGYALVHGRGVETDAVEGFNWFQKSAAQGYPFGQNNLGYAYAIGRGVKQDFEKAVALYRQAAEAKNALAQTNLAMAYTTGQGIGQDLKVAAEWFRQAAEQGNREAQFQLGVVYSIGRGVDANQVEAFQWYQRAANQGHTIAQNNLADSYEFGKGVAKDEVQAIKWYRLAADKSTPTSLRSLSAMYADGRGVEKDLPTALALLRQAAELGFGLAQFDLAQAYATGRGVDKDEAASLNWYRKAAATGSKEALEKLQQMGLRN